MGELVGALILLPIVAISEYFGLFKRLQPREFFLAMASHAAAFGVTAVIGFIYLGNLAQKAKLRGKPPTDWDVRLTWGCAIVAVLALFVYLFAAHRSRWPEWDGWLGAKAGIKTAMAFLLYFGCLQWYKGELYFSNWIIFGLPPKSDFQWAVDFLVVFGPPPLLVFSGWLFITGIVKLWLLIPRKPREPRRRKNMTYGEADPLSAADLAAQLGKR